MTLQLDSIRRPYALFVTTALASGLVGFAAPPVAANPQGGEVVAGSATIAEGSPQTTITQTSPRAIVNWQRFSIGESETTRFNQPDKKAITLNRVLGGEQSNIKGALKANGQVWLVNRNGVVIGPSASIDVHGLLATTTDIRNEDFMAGRYKFTKPSAVPGAAVVNEGNISIGEHGLGALVAPHVRNDGVIAGRLGQVVLAGTPTYTIDLHGDGLMRFAADSQVTEAIAVEEAVVSNNGTIDAEGGTVLITADAAAAIVENVINMDGVVSTHSVKAENGTIVLDGGDHGIVRVAGTLDATGGKPGERGGRRQGAGREGGAYQGRQGRRFRRCRWRSGADRWQLQGAAPDPGGAKRQADVCGARDDNHGGRPPQG